MNSRKDPPQKSQETPISLDQPKIPTTHTDIVAASEGRLQRSQAEGGVYITRFKQILTRHGVFILLVSLLCLLLPTAFTSLSWGLASPLKDVRPYLMMALLLFAFFIIYSSMSARALDKRQVSWIFYLLFISLGEEWVFRLALPGLLRDYIDPLYAVIFSNFIFIKRYFSN